MSVSVEGWLPALVSNNRFFTPCSKCSDCHSARESSLNYWDIDTKEELCSICLQKEPRENVLQVRFGGLGRGQIHSRYFLIHFSFYGILNMRIIVVIGSSIIVSWCRQGGRYCQNGRHFSHSVVCDQWIQGIIPQAATTAKTTKGSCWGLSVCCLLKTLAGRQLVLFLTVQDGWWQWSGVEGWSVYDIKQEWHAWHATGTQRHEAIYAVFFWQRKRLSRRVYVTEAQERSAEAFSDAVESIMECEWTWRYCERVSMGYCQKAIWVQSDDLMDYQRFNCFMKCFRNDDVEERSFVDAQWGNLFTLVLWRPTKWDV